MLTHDLRPAPDGTWGDPGFHHVDGELLVYWHTYGAGDELRGYWHSSAGTILMLEGTDNRWMLGADTVTLPLPGGGRVTGAGVLYPGDTAVPRRRRLIGDGTSFWTWDGDVEHWREHDPSGMADGRLSMPGFLAAALRVVRGLRAARARHDGHRLADLVSALRELLLTAGRLAAADPDPALVGTARRAYRQGEGLRVYGVCREPVISATGYGGVVTHLVAEDGRWFSVADVRPGGSARARGAATATVALGAAALDHARLARGGLLISGATISPEGRLGAGRGVRANPVAGLSWSASPLAALFARPLAETADVTFSGNPWEDPQDGGGTGQPVGCDLVIVGAEGDRVLARELPPREEQDGGAGSFPAPAGPSGAACPLPGPVVSGEAGPLIRLAPADSHPDLAHVANLRQLASRPGLRVRAVGRLDPDRAATLRPLAIGPVPGAGPTLRLPAEWMDRADLGYDRLRGSYLPSREECRPWEEATEAGTDLVAASPLWRVRHLVELAVSGGRRAVAESARGDSLAQRAGLRRAGFETAADLVGVLTAEADRRTRDVFGRLADPGGDLYAWTWLAAAVHLTATERALVRASWHDGQVRRAFGEPAG
ncbi:hypothetical protein OG884_33625 [Streptosporangium sp. NBC_01755]|uniref:hypothetical protein n=1 Tax=unclassified Streptosporangium TaxID=2632669 RepID=UPI002DDC74B7|nr:MULTISPECIES: hypothetical protein [unclassified Streptosporangium]WSA28860.1 hypothetical protein OIE13_13860 [Streptosporangium sp. NBC_01810]WSC99694.1 hypothetical protein OG884_33625 [Streptosporangium sp. NBC_01755]